MLVELPGPRPEKGILETVMSLIERGKKWNKLRIKNMSFFVVERFHQFIQM